MNGLDVDGDRAILPKWLSVYSSAINSIPSKLYMYILSFVAAYITSAFILTATIFYSNEISTVGSCILVSQIVKLFWENLVW